MNERLMKKIARPSYWDKIESGLRKITNLPGPVHAVLGDREKLKFHQALPPGIAPDAKAYVTTEDTNDDGNIETINIVVTNLEKEWPQDVLSKINQMDESDPVFQDILSGVAKTLIHELAHIGDHKDGAFPGGEGIAESRENAFSPNFGAASITNVSNKANSPLEISKKGDIKMKKELIKLANHLDGLGHQDLADRLDMILKKAEWPNQLESNQLDSVVVEGTTEDEGTEVEEDDTDDFGLGATEASNKIDEMAKLISREFSLTSGGNINRD